ncbi:MAG: HXXEE domain-containing protein [Chloroflexi bacterium]|nr:HXXEE domain-containing protein [Chloroflexota bacterium]
MNLLDGLSFIQLLWGVPVLLAIHNLEEAPFMEKWSKELPLPIHPIVSTRQFVTAVTLLTIAGFAATYFGITTANQPIGISIVLGIQMVMLVNAIAPHLVTALRFRKYSPGVVTALILNVPFSIYLFQRAMREGYLSWPLFWILLVIAPFAMIFLASASLQAGKLIITKKRLFS